MPVDFFAKKPNALIEHRAITERFLKIENYLKKKSGVNEYETKFDPKNSQHIEFLQACSKSVKEHLQSLQTIDKYMVAGLALGILAFSLSFIIPVATIAMIGFGFAAYQYGLRQQAYLEHQTALETLTKCCIWTLGIASEDKKENEAIKKCEAIEEMTETLAPLTNEEQIRRFIDDKTEEHYVQKTEQVKKDLSQNTNFDKRLIEDPASFLFQIYGYEQGGFGAFWKGLAYAIVNGFKAIKAKFSPAAPVPENPAEEIVASAVGAAR